MIGALSSDLEHAATTLPPSIDKGKAAFSLFVCYALGGYTSCKDVRQALDYVVTAAEAGYPPAFLCGRRAFEANSIPNPEIFRQEPPDRPIREFTHALQQVPSSMFYPELIRLVLPQAVRTRKMNSLGSIHGYESNMDFVHWLGLKHNEIGTSDFRQFAQDTFLFQHAIIKSDHGACQTLLQLGCSLNVPDADGTTPLHLALQCAEIGILQLFLNHGAADCLNITYDVPILHWLVVLPEEALSAISNRFLGDLDEEKRTKLCSSDLTFVLDEFGLSLKATPLEWAIQCGNLAAVKALTGPGAFVPMNPRQISYLAAGMGCIDILQYFLKMDGFLQRLSRVDKYDLFTSLGNQGNYLTHWLMHGSSNDSSIGRVIDTLEEFGIHLPLITLDGKEGKDALMPPLSRAATGSHVHVMRELLSRGVDVNESSVGAKMTPLEFAFMGSARFGPSHRAVETVQLLLSHGAQAGRWSNLHAACDEEVQFDVFKVVLQADLPSINTTYAKRTPLLRLLSMRASLDLHSKVQALLEAGSDIDSEVCDGMEEEDSLECGWTALVYSLDYLQWIIAAHLLNKGASLQYNTNSGHHHTVLQFLVFKAFNLGSTIRQEEYREVLRVIRKLLIHPEAKKANLISAIDYRGIDALSLSVMFGMADIVAIFLEKEHGVSFKTREAALHLIPPLMMPIMAPRFVAMDDAECEKIMSQRRPCYTAFGYKERLKKIERLLFASVGGL